MSEDEESEKLDETSTEASEDTPEQTGSADHLTSGPAGREGLADPRGDAPNAPDLLGTLSDSDLADTQERKIPPTIVAAPTPVLEAPGTVAREPPDYSIPTRDREGRGRSRFAALGWIIAVLLLVGGAAFWFVAVRPLQARLQQAKEASERVQGQLEEAQAQLEVKDQAMQDLEEEVKKLRASEAELTAEAVLKEQALKAMEQTQEELSDKLKEQIKKGEVLLRQSGGQLVMDLQDKILFNSGEAQINESGETVLRSVGETFLKLKDKIIHVAGNTDSLGISKNLIDKFPTNWELSTARATNVVRFLQEEVGVPGERLVAIGNSQYRPVASNRTKAGRRRNRRIEVTLVQRPAAARK